MAEKEDQLSPEEKLLKVIQQGGPASAVSPAAPAGRAKLEVAGDADEAGAAPVAQAAAGAVPPRLPPKIRPPTQFRAAAPGAPVARPVAKVPPVAPSAATKGAASPVPRVAPVAAPAASSASAAPSPAAVAPAAVPAASAAPRLKVAPPSKSASSPAPARPAEKPKKVTQKPVPTAGLIGAGPRPTIKKKRHRKTPLISTISRGLAAAAVLLLFFTGWEIRAAILRVGQHESSDRLPGIVPDAATISADLAAGGGTNVTMDMIELARIQKMYDERPLFILASAKRPEGTVTTNVVTTVGGQTEWESYARKNFKLKGLSALPSGDLEAIVSDNASGKLQYLKANDRLFVDRRNVKVESVDAESIVLTDGARRVQIK